MSSSLDSSSKSKPFVSGNSNPSTSKSAKYISSYTPPKPWYRPSNSLRTYVLIALPLLSLLGAFGTWTLAGTNGTFESIIALVVKDGTQLPGTNDDLVKSYTGVAFLDSQLSILVTFFAPLTGDVTHENGALHLFSIFGIGQFGAVWCLMVMESLRIGNQSRSTFLVGFGFIGVVGIIFQNISYTITSPLWLFAHILTSPVSKISRGTHASTVLLIPAWDLRVLPVSVIIGYLLPTILMGLPSPAKVKPETHQYLIAFWQAFPVWTVVTHSILSWSFKLAAAKISPTNKESSPQSHLGNSYLSNARHVYRFVLGLCMITHIPVVLISLLPASTFPSSAGTLAQLAENNFTSVFIPYLPLSLKYQAASLSEGVHTFLLWDLHVGSVAFLLWAALLYRNATTDESVVDSYTNQPTHKELLLGEEGKGSGQWKKLGAKIATWSVISGPIGAVAVLLWERDMIVRQKIKQGV